MIRRRVQRQEVGEQLRLSFEEEHRCNISLISIRTSSPEKVIAILMLIIQRLELNLSLGVKLIQRV